MEILYRCPLCGSNKIKAHSVRYKEFYPHCTRSKCLTCQLVFANPMENKIELECFYQNYYDNGNFLKDNWKTRISNYFRQSDQLSTEEFIQKNKRALNYYCLSDGTGKKFLDIGCGLGKDVYVAAKLKWEVYATEYDNDALTFISQNVSNANLFQGEFFNANYPDNFFDYVLVYHVIEHVLDPTAMVKELKRIIKPGGVLFIGTPNIGSIGYRIYRQIYFLKGSIPGIVDGMEHTFLFTKNRLASLLNENGFKIQLHKTEAHTEGFISIMKSEDTVKRKLSRIIQLIFKVNQRVVCIKHGTS